MTESLWPPSAAHGFRNLQPRCLFPHHGFPGPASEAGSSSSTGRDSARAVTYLPVAACPLWPSSAGWGAWGQERMPLSPRVCASKIGAQTIPSGALSVAPPVDEWRMVGGSRTRRLGRCQRKESCRRCPPSRRGAQTVTAGFEQRSTVPATCRHGGTAGRDGENPSAQSGVPSLQTS
jgi:hypothetical protein